MSHLVFLYLLVDPRDKSVRYIGQSKDPALRFQAHCCPNRADYKNNWVRNLRSIGLLPRMSLIGVAKSKRQANKIEIALIAAGRRLGWNLTNGTDGGEGARGVKLTDEQREIRRINTTASWTPERREHYSKNNPNNRPEVIEKKKAVWTEEKRRQFGAYVSSRLTKEHQAKMTAAAAKAWTPERRAKISAVHKGKLVSEATRRRISESNLGKVCSEYARMRASQVHKGVPLTAEHRAKIGAGIRAFYLRRKEQSNA